MQFIALCSRSQYCIWPPNYCNSAAVLLVPTEATVVVQRPNCEAKLNTAFQTDNRFRLMCLFVHGTSGNFTDRWKPQYGSPQEISHFQHSVLNFGEETSESETKDVSKL